MKKSLIVFLAAVLIVAAGCQKAEPAAPAPQTATTNTTPVANTWKNDCYPLKLANGKYVFSTTDAGVTMGSLWSMDFDLSTNESDDKAVLNCRYAMKDLNGRFIVVDKSSEKGESKFIPYTSIKKDIPNLGDRAAFQNIANSDEPNLYIQKGKDTVWIFCGYKDAAKKGSPCTESDLIKVGQAMSANWVSVGTAAVSENKAPDTEEMKIAETCYPLKNKAGEYILNPKDMETIRGGTWEMSDELFIDPEDVGYVHCAYQLDSTAGDSVMIQTGPLKPGMDPSQNYNMSCYDGKTNKACPDVDTAKMKEVVMGRLK